jgi:hypothetical protein
MAAYTGLLDLISAGGGTRIGVPDWDNLSDHGFTDPSTSIEVRIDINIVSGFAVSENIIACASGTNNRQWAITASVGGITQWAYAFSTGGTTWNTFVESGVSGLDENKRIQLRLVHSGTTVTMYDRDPAVHNQNLDNDSNWSLRATHTSQDNVNTMADELSGFRLATGLTGALIHSDILYETWVKYDGTKVVHLIGGNATIDAPSNTVTDELSVSWGWTTDTDPTVTANPPFTGFKGDILATLKSFNSQSGSEILANLQAAGATSKEIVGALNELNATSGVEFERAYKTYLGL